VVSDQRIRVIVIDHHRMFTETLATFLSQHEDIVVEGVADLADRGVALAESLRPDVAVVDYRLPDEDGAAVTRRIQAVSPGTKVLVIAGYADKHILTSAVKAGCSGFVTKDKAARELVVAIRGAHYGGVYLPPRALDGLAGGGPVPAGRVGANLTRRELGVLQLLADGYSNQSIASELTLSLHTVRNHVQRILGKLGAHSKLEAVSIAYHEDLVRSPE